MFSLPVGAQDKSSSEPIYIDEKAEVLCLVVFGLYQHHYQAKRETVMKDVGNKQLVFEYQDFFDSQRETMGKALDRLQAISRFHHKYEIDVTRELVDAELLEVLRRNPCQGFAYASRCDDLELGRRAISLMEFTSFGSHDDRDHVGFWDDIEEVRPSWQAAFAKLVFSSIFASVTGEDSRGHYTHRYRAPAHSDMDRIARDFDPA
jgi:hypothetical protein